MKLEKYSCVDDDDFDDEEEDEDCFECGGEGWIVDECFEDTCCCADPETQHGLIRCPNCKAGTLA